MNRVVLVSCASKKRQCRSKAKDLYISSLFRLNLAYARLLKPNKIFILSAKYGLTKLDQELEPYDQTLNTMSNLEIEEWAEKVRAQMKQEIDFENDEVIFLAGKNYRKYLVPFLHEVKIPLKSLGIGKQLHFLKAKIDHAK